VLTEEPVTPAVAAPPERLSRDRAAFAARTRFGSLDGIRALAVLAVVWHHTVLPASWLPMSGRGFLGVDMFFVLSGFLIVTLLLREEDTSGKISLRHFYVRRSLRIFPLYYAILLLMAVYTYGSASQSEVAVAFRENLPYYGTYLSNWFGLGGLLAVSWSLAAEEQFYLVWPPIQKLLRGAAVPALFGLILSNQLVNFGLLFSAAREEREILQVTFTPILFGVGLAYLLHHHYHRLWPVLGRRWAPAVLVALLAGIVNLPSGEASLVGVHRLAVHVVMVALIAAVVMREDHVLARPLSLPVLVRVGAISYGVYLLHMFVRHAVAEITDRFGLGSVPLLLFAATAIGTIAAAEISFRYFETPIIRLKHRFGRSEAQPVVAGRAPRIT
jgi:peptidoglycan/LPS O-acetylase OafA/YrhL